MHDFAARPAAERAEIFEETAARRGIGRAVIVEKDFWVCWVLAALFGPGGPSDTSMSASPALLFKGGTSLSKVYGLIDRFSEDVDLTVDRNLLIGPDERPETVGLSGGERKRRIEHIEARCIDFVRDRILPFLSGQRIGGMAVAASADSDDPQTLWFAYPRALSDAAYGGAAYVHAVIRLEFGARGELWPAEAGRVSSYAAQEFPALFSAGAVQVRALSPRRTFWEKATILHAIAMKGELGAAERQSRHYADIARLIGSEVAEEALADPGLLSDVARHKTLYFASPRARYDLAAPGSLRLVPPAPVCEALERDYMKMREMFIVEPPRCGEVLAAIERFEGLVNAVRT